MFPSDAKTNNQKKPTNLRFVHILIDYDNLELQQVNEIQSVIDQIVFLLYKNGLVQKEIETEFHVRLYGGWDELNNVNNQAINQASKLATELSAFLYGAYPLKNTKPKNRINVELSHSLVAKPEKMFPFTFRQRRTLSRIRICKPEDDCCADSKVHMDFLRKLRKSHSCPFCNTESSRIVWMSEQKLVDTLLSMDLSYYATYDPLSLLVVVSDDDDFIPAIFQQCYLNHQIIHIQKTPGICYNAYFQLVTSEYYKVLYL